ncbi:fructosamine kinase family protein [Zunongwangia sp. F363]|uniref:Fructosamine kinase family protein n=1 Tax=Autumnicola tepida TaxID=3075595 RepID=A0ABU3C5B2_9FLAO|nr:fructosamine kinase family protein [Zunongwangia sp. F363]MDT0641473.1 fructosamine kinase family protein [Zunongwangia sp. F363]
MSVNKFSEIINAAGEAHGFSVKNTTPLSGGDINDVFLIETGSADKLVIKINDAARYPGMFEAEKAGLDALRKSGIIKVPKTLHRGEVEEQSYLILEFLEAGKKSSDFWKIFGKQMAELHKVSAENFGFETDNYIGSLPQYNSAENSAADFYVNQRLEPQFKMAKDRGYDLGNKDNFLKNCSGIIPDEAPALIHGDLWNGNYMTSTYGMPVLIDPAVAFAPREMDLAMMKLFGGFDARMFQAYHKHFPLAEGFEERVPLWQLYYLLVHLNIFGSRYKASVENILRRYR